MDTARFGTYVHSDATTPHKGAAIIALRGDAATAAAAARLAYGAGAAAWDDVTAAFPDAPAADVLSIAVVRLGRGETGRVDTLSDAGRAVAVKVLSATDFGARTAVFASFTSAVARAALDHGLAGWDALSAADPGLEAGRSSLSRELRERIEVAQVEILSL